MRFPGALMVVALLAATGAAAQPSGEIFGGAAAVFADNGSDGFALPTDGRTIVPMLGVAVTPRTSRLGFQFEVDLPRDMTKRVPGQIKAGPVTYVITRRDLVASVLVSTALVRRAVTLNALTGVSAVRNRTAVRYAFQDAAPEPATTALAFSTGLDLVSHSGGFVIVLPRIRFHYTRGLEREDGFGFAPGPLLASVGVSIGWRW